MKTDEVCDRPLETFGAHPCYLIYIGSYSVSVLFVFLSNGFAQAAWNSKSCGAEGVKGASAQMRGKHM